MLMYRFAYSNELAQSEAYWLGEEGCAASNHTWVR